MKPSNDREAITLIIEGLIDQGCELTEVFDGEDDILVSTTAEAVEAITAVDEATLYLTLPAGSDRRASFVFFVLGNDPEEVACDYGVSLSSLIEPIIDPWWK